MNLVGTVTDLICPLMAVSIGQDRIVGDPKRPVDLD